MTTFREFNLIEKTGMTRRAIKARQRRIALAIYAEWRKLTRTLKFRYQKPYRDAMVFNFEGNKISLGLTFDTFARSIEYGYGSGGVGTRGTYDMRRTLLRPGGKSVRISKTGHRYLHVPFRVTTRKIVAKGGYAAYRMAQKLMASYPQDGKTLWGGRLGAQFHKHLTSLYRFPRIGHARGGSTYGTFRTISTGVPDGWRHPGIPAHRLIRKVASRVGQIASRVM